MPYFWPYRPKVGISGHWSGKKIGVKKIAKLAIFLHIIYRARYALQVFPATSRKKQVKNSQMAIFLSIIYRGQICPTFGLIGQKQVFPAAGQEKIGKKIANWLFFLYISCRVDMPCRYFRPLVGKICKKIAKMAIFLHIIYRGQI